MTTTRIKHQGRGIKNPKYYDFWDSERVLELLIEEFQDMRDKGIKSIKETKMINYRK